jgi:hypothetical protein
MLMSLSEPLSLVVAGITTPLPRLPAGENEGVFQSGDGIYRLTASHNYGKRTRRMIRLDANKISPDVFKPDENVKQSMSVYIVFDIPSEGQYTPAEILAAHKGFLTLITASSDLMVSKVLGGES